MQSCTPAGQGDRFKGWTQLSGKGRPDELVGWFSLCQTLALISGHEERKRGSRRFRFITAPSGSLPTRHPQPRTSQLLTVMTAVPAPFDGQGKRASIRRLAWHTGT